MQSPGSGCHRVSKPAAQRPWRPKLPPNGAESLCKASTGVVGKLLAGYGAAARTPEKSMSSQILETTTQSSAVRSSLPQGTSTTFVESALPVVNVKQSA